ncbi:MAG: hypothetical protein WC862_03005 [Patescibacteria group bacterium]
MKNVTLISLFVALFVVAACGGEGGSTDGRHNDQDAGHDVGEEDDYRSFDSRFTEAEEETTDEQVVRMDAIWQPEVAEVGLDARFDPAEIGFDADVAADTLDVFADISDVHDLGADSDLLDGGDAARLTVERAPDMPVFQIVEDPDTDGEQITLGAFSLCAESSDVTLKTTTLTMEGWFGDLSLEVIILNASGDATVIFSEPRWFGGMEMNLLDLRQTVGVESCSTLVLATRTPLREGNRWMQVRLTGLTVVEVEDSEILIMESAYIGTRTIFRPGEGVVASRANYWRDVMEYARDGRFLQIGSFKICADEWTRGSVRSVEFHLEMDSETVALPLDMTAYVTEWDGDSTYLENRAVFLRNGGAYRWESARPDDSAEPLNWGGCLNFNWSMWAAPDEVSELRMFVDAVDAEDSTVLAEYPPYGIRGVMDTPLPWSLIRLIEPAPVAPQVNLYWTGRADLNRREWFGWEEDLFDCWRSAAPDGEDNPALSSRACSLAGITGTVQYIDPRFPPTLESIEASIYMEGYTSIDVMIFVTTKWEAEIVYLERMTLSPGENPIAIPLDYRWNRDTGTSFEFGIAIPPQELVSTVEDEFGSPVIGLTMENVVATYVGEELPISIWAPERPGTYDYARRPLPYTGPDMRFHVPELWLVSHEEGPVTTVVIGEERTEPIRLFDARVQAPFGAVTVHRLTFVHGTSKEEPPLGSVWLQMDGATYVLVYWDRVNAIFEPPSDATVTVSQQSWSWLVVYGSQPLEETVPSEPLHFRLVDVVITPQDRAEPELGMIIGLTLEGEPIYLDEEHPVMGMPVRLIE